MALAVLAAVLLFLAVGWSDRHYWDEYLYLYSAFAHSPSELVHFETGTAIFPTGFFSEKLGHVVLLRLLTGSLGAGELVLYLVECLYALLLVGLFGAAYGLLRDLFGPRWARDSTLVLMFTPLALYLAFKTLSEIPSLLLATLASWAFVRSCRREAGPGGRAFALFAGLALAAGMLFRITAVVAFGGLGLALLLSGGERFDRRRVFTTLLATGLGAAAIHTAGLALAGASVLRLGSHIHSMLSTHPQLQRIYAAALFLQTLVLVLPFTWRLRSDPTVRLAWVWFLASAAPFVAGHEPRYYAPAIVPLAVLAAAGLREANRVLLGLRLQYAWIGLLAALVAANRILLSPLMPWEVDQRGLLALFDDLRARAPEATYLVPWISDYSVLRFAHPDARVMLCLSNVPGSRHYLPGRSGPLEESDRWWAGTGHYLGTRDELAGLPRPWYLVGWTYSPPALHLAELLDRAGLGGRARTLPRLHNHLAGTWVWSDPSLIRAPGSSLGQYSVFEVEPR